MQHKKATLTHSHATVPNIVTSSPDSLHFSMHFQLAQPVIRSVLLALSPERSKNTYQVHVNDLPLVVPHQNQ